jgi:hypothetical protein
MECQPELMCDAEFARAFETCELPNQVFRHREHVRLTFIYLRLYGFEGARARIAEAIRRYAAHNGAPRKYHETITFAWMRIVNEAAANVEDGGGFAEMIAAFPHLLNKGEIQKYYSDTLLGSETARASFVEPDRKPLPEVARNGFARQGKS